VIGDELGQPKHLKRRHDRPGRGHPRRLYGGLGVARPSSTRRTRCGGSAQQQAEPRQRPAPQRGLLGTAGLAVLATTGLSIMGGGGAGALGQAAKYLALGASVLINIAVCIFASGTRLRGGSSVRDVAPGAVASAVAWQLLQSFGVIYVRHVISTPAPRTRCSPSSSERLRSSTSRRGAAALRGDQRHSRQPAASPGAAHPVHRQRLADVRGPAGVRARGQGPAQQGLRAGRRHVQ